MVKLLSIFGTRPEAIKMAPLVHALSGQPHLTSEVCVTGPHENLAVMRAGQDLTSLTTAMLTGLRDIYASRHPDMVLVHGDTTTALAASLAAFYARIPIAHIEAGLRTHDLSAPWPEEGNRALIARLATLHFAPTPHAKENLLREGIAAKHIVVTGNTVIDALKHTERTLARDAALNASLALNFPNLREGAELVLITGHRRESFGEGLANICRAVTMLAAQHPHVEFAYPVHLNPNVETPVRALLGGIANVHLLAPQDYLSFVYLMRRARFILTDSGGIQEEAPALGKPVLLMRDTTERPEAIEAGTVRLVGTGTAAIVQEANALFSDSARYRAMSTATNPYGDGFASERIRAALGDHFGLGSSLLHEEPQQSMV